MGKRILSLMLLCALMLTAFAGCEAHTHSYGKWKTTEEATCEEAGKKVRICECGKEQSKTIPQLEHEYESSVTKEAACEQAGVTTFKCKHCGDSYTEEIAKLAHDYDMVVTKENTCTLDGVTTGTCQLCGDVKTETTSRTGHDYDEAVTKEASCQGNGEKTFSCKKCEDSYIEQILYPSYTATEIYDMYEKSVGEVHAFDEYGNGIALGSCFVMTADGQLITNYHVIEDAYSAEVVFGENTYEVRQVLAYDSYIDVAILKIDAVDLVPATLCKQTHQVGKTVYALGSSKGLTATMSDGMITFADREDGGVHYVQHDAPISGGNSGGPLINEYGEVIGINTLTLLDSQNLNFAIALTELDNLDYSHPMSMAEVYEAESNAYKKLIRYVATEENYDAEDGDYFDTFSANYNSDYTSIYSSFVAYEPADGSVTIGMTIMDSSTYEVGRIFYITLNPELNGIYEWYCGDDSYTLIGTIYWSYERGDTLSYSDTNISNISLRNAYLDLATAMAAYLLNEVNVNSSTLGTTASGLGFTYF